MDDSLRKDIKRILQKVNAVSFSRQWSSSDILDVLDGLDDLEFLTLQDVPIKIDLYKHQKLKYLVLRSNQKFINIENINQLEDITVFGSNKILGKNCELFESLPKVRSIDLVRPNINSLDGLSKLDLISFELYSPRGLTSVHGIENCSNTLKRLWLHFVHKIDYTPTLEKLENIERLWLRGSKEIKNINFLDRMKNIEHAEITEIKILDGNVNYFKNKLGDALYIYPMKNYYY